MYESQEAEIYPSTSGSSALPFEAHQRITAASTHFARSGLEMGIGIAGCSSRCCRLRRFRSGYRAGRLAVPLAAGARADAIGVAGFIGMPIGVGHVAGCWIIAIGGARHACRYSYGFSHAIALPASMASIRMESRIVRPCSIVAPSAARFLLFAGWYLFHYAAPGVLPDPQARHPPDLLQVVCVDIPKGASHCHPRRESNDFTPQVTMVCGRSIAVRFPSVG